MNDDVKVTWHEHSIGREDREKLNGHRGCVVWFTGLSGSGKSTVASLVEQQLHGLGRRTFLLDGDNIRHGLCASEALLGQEHSEEFAKRFGLGFSAIDREENIRRIGTVAELFRTAGIITLVAFVSPYRRDRDAVRDRIEKSGQPGDFVEVFIDTPLDICEQRDPKGLYKLARKGELRGMTGIDDPYEAPENPEIHLAAGHGNPQELAATVVTALEKSGIIP